MSDEVDKSGWGPISHAIGREFRGLPPSRRKMGDDKDEPKLSALDLEFIKDLKKRMESRLKGDAN